MINNTESNLILSDEMKIRERLQIDELIKTYPFDEQLLEEMFNLVVEVIFSRGNSFDIASNVYDSQYVKSRFMQLDDSHIEYVLGYFKSNTTKVRNIKKYLLAALFNASSTMHGFYCADVNYDMYMI